MHERTNLLRAWARWDDRPGDPEVAIPMEQACRIVAPRVHLTVNQFREVISALRRQGMSREAIADWLLLDDGLDR